MPLADDLTGWRGARRPVPVALQGASVLLRPLHPASDAAALHEASHGPGADPALWRHLTYGPFADEGAHRRWLDEAAADDERVTLAVVAREQDRPAGIVRLLNVVPEHGRIELGGIWFGPTLQRTRATTEALYLALHHVFEDLDNRRAEWKCDTANARSRAAALRLGFAFEGIFRRHMVVRGRSRDTAWFAITDADWPGARDALQAWLHPSNFDADGRQRTRLAALRDAHAER